MKFLSLTLMAVAAVGCSADAKPSPNAPTLIASGTHIGWSKSVDDSGFAIAGTINGHPIQLIADYGANASGFVDTVFDAVHLQRMYANATRTKKTVVHGNKLPVLDSTANATIQVSDTIWQYWGEFKPVVVDSIRFGSSLQTHVYVPIPYSSASYSMAGLIGRDMLSQFDVEFVGDSILLYARTTADSATRAPKWLPPRISANQCMRAVVAGPTPMPHIDPSDTANMTREDADALVGARRMYDQIELKFPSTIDGHTIDATFDSGTSDAIINSAAAQRFGFTSANPHVHVDSASGDLYITGAVLQMGKQILDARIVWVDNTKFQKDEDFRTKPMMMFGLAQFRNRDLLMSHSSGMVCIGNAK